MPMTKNRVRVSQRKIKNRRIMIKNPASGGIFLVFQQIKIICYSRLQIRALPGAKHFADLNDLADMVGVMIGDQ